MTGPNPSPTYRKQKPYHRSAFKKDAETLIDRKCLKCGTGFRTTSPYIRMCAPCKKRVHI